MPELTDSLGYLLDFVIQAAKQGATDVHFELETVGPKSWINVRLRKDSILRDMAKVEKPLEALKHMLDRAKSASDIDFKKRFKGQDGHLSLKREGLDVDIRVASIATVTGERLALRLIDNSHYQRKLEELGMLDDILKLYRAVISKPQGFNLITGPTGSGKSTTLYATLRGLACPEKNIMTIEDPVECRIPGIGQIEVHAEAGLDFFEGLRAIMRQDPDIVLVGEIRDLETAKAAIRAALAGCLVFTTLHARDAASTAIRLLEMGVEPFLVANSLNGAVSQRLIRCLCKACQGKGCPDCEQTGYKGRTGMFEIMNVTEKIRELIFSKASVEKIREQALAEGMLTLRAYGDLLMKKGITDQKEVQRVLGL
jgi:type II secretory ATPase GspE/PulE/Tfp pilus assembly ATPase PilB-like protein